jgi:hypothetical protein
VTLVLGKLGSIPSRHDPRTINYKAVRAILEPELRVPPLFYDARPKDARWRIYGNDRYGCCTFAGIVRIMENNAHRRGKTLIIPDQHVIDAYLALTGGEDVGAMPINALNYMRNIGIDGHKVLAYARVSDDLFERQSAMKTFGSLYVAAGLPAALDRDRDLRWELTPHDLLTPDDEARSLGGHAYPVFGYQHHEEFAVPWTQEIVEEDAWTDYYREESWVFIDSGETDQEILDVMQAQITAIKEHV